MRQGGYPPPTKVTIVGQNDIYKRENLVGPFLGHKLLGPRPPLPKKKFARSFLRTPKPEISSTLPHLFGFGRPFLISPPPPRVRLGAGPCW